MHCNAGDAVTVSRDDFEDMSATRHPTRQDADKLLAKIVELHETKSNANPQLKTEVLLSEQEIYNAIDHLDMNSMQRSLLDLATNVLVETTAGSQVQPTLYSAPYLALREAIE